MSDLNDAVFASSPSEAVFGASSDRDASALASAPALAFPDMEAPDPAVLSVADEARIALQLDLEQCASALTKDPDEARRLIDMTLARTDEDARNGTPLPEGRVAIYRMLRQAYHSVERTRVRRSARPAPASAATTTTPASSFPLVTSVSATESN